MKHTKKKRNCQNGEGFKGCKKKACETKKTKEKTEQIYQNERHNSSVLRACQQTKPRKQDRGHVSILHSRHCCGLMNLVKGMGVAKRKKKQHTLRRARKLVLVGAEEQWNSDQGHGKRKKEIWLVNKSEKEDENKMV